MFACFHHLAFPSPVSFYFLFILTPFSLLFSSFCPSWAPQGRQDRPKIATRAAQDPPRSSPETPRAAQDHPKTPPKSAPRLPRTAEHGFCSFLAHFCFLLAPVLASFCFFFVVFYHYFEVLSNSMPTAFQQHSRNIPTAFFSI